MTARTEIFKRWMVAWRLLAAATFVVVGFSTLSRGDGSLRFWLLYAGLVVWYAGSVPIGRDRLYGSLPVSLLYFLPGWVMWFGLLRLNPATFGFAAIFFPLTYTQLPIKRAILFALVLIGLMYLNGTGPVDWDFGSILGAGLGVASTIILALFINAIIKQSEQRNQLIQELETARADLAAAERQAGVQQERQRLAQEIHDTVAQGFVGIITHLEAAETVLHDPAALARHVTAAKASARESLREARQQVWNLRPDLLNAEPLATILERQLGHWSRSTGIGAEHVVTGTPRKLDTDREETLVQAAREGLSNVRAHARAGRVTLTLSYMEDEVVLDLADDGAGNRSAPNPEGGYGLRALRERVRALGGRCELESRDDGATLSVALPAGG